MFLDSDFNGGSWGSFEEDYNNFGSMGTTIGNTVAQIKDDAQTQIDEILDEQNKGKVIVRVNGNNRTISPSIRNINKSISGKDFNDGKMSLLENVNADLNMQLQTQRENAKRSNLIMYGLLGIIAIVVLKRK
jgi:hypothetical protein